MMNGLQALPQWKEFMHNPQGAYLGMVNAIQALGGCIGYPAMAQIANRWGRKIPIYIGCVIISLAVGLQTGAHNRDTFIASRFLVGLASGFFGAAPILITETAFPTHRGKITAGYK
jgi:MFS family permease